MRWRPSGRTSGLLRTTGGLLALAVAATFAVVGVAVGPAGAAPGCSINIVAHPDDDLFFQSPSILPDVQVAACLTTVYVTSGDAGAGTGYSRQRELGVQAAYAQMAGTANTWSTSVVTLAGRGVTLATLAGRPQVRLAFLRLPDGNIDGSGTGTSGYTSLQQLFQNQVASLRTVDTPVQDYTRAGLVQTLGALINASGAASIRTHDERGRFGDGDHSDHYAVARLAFEARAAAAPSLPIAGYLGYPGAQLPANVSGAELTAKQNAFLTYAPYDAQMCKTLAQCSGRPEGTWLPRQHLSTALPGREPIEDGNAAPIAEVTASSENPNDGQTAAKAVDGVVDGYPGDATAEWATRGGGAGSWLQLEWLEPIQLGSVVLYDRPNTADRVTGATLTFSDGSTVSVPALDDAGGAVVVSFPARITTVLRVTVSSVSGTTENVGLAELQAWTPGSGPPPTTTPPPSPTTTPPTTTPPTTTPPTTTPPTTTPP
ncbi:DUF7402 domain-containing protein, partial [Modestobacter roseus]